MLYLLGDSILDSSFGEYNGVNNNNTGQVLHRMGAKVLDLSTEGVTAQMFYTAIRQKKYRIPVRRLFVLYRQSIHYPYPFEKDGKMDISANRMRKGETVYLSLGGNDLVHGHLAVLERNVRYIVQYYQSQGLKVVYIIPYKVDRRFLHHYPEEDRPTVRRQYKKMLAILRTVIKDTGLDHISLQDFTARDKGNQAPWFIPEPTIQGARKIAERIFEHQYGHLSS